MSDSFNADLLKDDADDDELEMVRAYDETFLPGKTFGFWGATRFILTFFPLLSISVGSVGGRI